MTEKKRHSQTKTAEFDLKLQGLVNTERAAVYGHPSDHFELSAELKRLIRANYEGDPRLLHALDMILDKIARLCHTDTHFDSWLDIAGYARTAVMILDVIESERKAREAMLSPNPLLDELRYKSVAKEHPLKPGAVHYVDDVSPNTNWGPDVDIADSTPPSTEEIKSND